MSPDPVNSKPAVLCRDVHKTYVVYNHLFRGLAHKALFPLRPNPHARQVHALKSVDFAVEKGEVFGILGHNGAGKSTLLACIAGISPVDGGSIEIEGHVDALLRLGVGFHPHFTGRENALLGLVTMGTPVEEARDAVDSVLDFAEVAEFGDMPFYTYSSGMKSRLQFGVAVHRTPDILILDEALSAGDGFFNSKARQRIEEICLSGSTVLLVTHSVSMVESLCNRAIILTKGELVDEGAAPDVGAHYRKMMSDSQVTRHAAYQLEGRASSGDIGTGEASIADARVALPEGADVAAWDKPLTFIVDIVAHEPIEKPRVKVDIYSARDGVLATNFSNAPVDVVTRKPLTVDLGRLEGPCRLLFHIPALPLGGSTYYWSFALYPGKRRSKLETDADAYVYRRVVGYFQVESFPERSYGRSVITETPVTVSVEVVRPMEAEVAEEVQ